MKFILGFILLLSSLSSYADCIEKFQGKGRNKKPIGWYSTNNGSTHSSHQACLAFDGNKKRM